jgi:putative ABC transport system permease protein
MSSGRELGRSPKRSVQPLGASREGSMNPLENVRMAFEALWGNRLRSFLALLGIVIGVFAVTAMISLGEMANATIGRDLESIAGRSIFVQPNFNEGVTSESAPVDEALVESLSFLPAAVIPQQNIAGQYEPRPGQRRGLQFQGTPGDMPKLDPTTKLARGRYFSAAEDRAGTAVAVLSASASKDLFGTRNPIGQTAKLFFTSGDRAELTVIGVLEPPAGLFGGFASGGTVSVSNRYLWANAPGVNRGQFDFLILSLNKSASSKSVLETTKRILVSRYGDKKYRVEATESLQGVLSSITGVLQALLAGIAGLSLFVGGIGIMNIMLVSVTERTREIGLRKALGATAAQIRQQFLIEAIVLTFTGGLMGVVFAVGLLLLAVRLLPFFGSFMVNPVTVVIALTVSVFIGLVFGVLPAARAAKLDPIEALRYE